MPSMLRASILRFSGGRALQRLLSSSSSSPWNNTAPLATASCSLLATRRFSSDSDAIFRTGPPPSRPMTTTADEDVEYWDDVLFDVHDKMHGNLKAAAKESGHALPRRRTSWRQLRYPSSSSSSSSSSQLQQEQQHASQHMLMFNVFTNRLVRSDSPSVRSLELIGLIPDPASRTLRLKEPLKLMAFARKLQRGEISAPKSWTSPLHKQLCSHLMTCSLPPPPTPDGDNDATIVEGAAPVQKPDVAIYVESWLDTLHTLQQVRSHAPAGVVAAPGGSVHTSSSSLAASAGAETDLYGSSSEAVSFDRLTEEQKKVVELACQGYHMYIGGGAGTGKTTLLKAVRQRLQWDLGLRVATTAITGIAAVNIQGTTLHHRFGITRELQFAKKKELAKYDAIIIDEISMVPLTLFETLDKALQKANGCTLPFGGVQMILCGDFMQLGAISDLPVVGSPLFRQHFVMVKLREVMRQGAASLFARQLDEMRRGVVPHDLCDTITFVDKLSSSSTASESEREPPVAVPGLTLLPVASSSTLQTVPPTADDASPPSTAPPPSTPTAMLHVVEDAINLLSTNADVAHVNRFQISKLPGSIINYPPLMLPPALKGRWSPTYMISVPPDAALFDFDRLFSVIEHHIFKASGAISLLMLTQTLATALAETRGTRSSVSTSLSSSTPAARCISLYRYFDDAFVLRVQYPPQLEDPDIRILEQQLASLDNALKAAFPSSTSTSRQLSSDVPSGSKSLPTHRNDDVDGSDASGCVVCGDTDTAVAPYRIVELIPNGTGMHTLDDMKSLEHMMQHSPVGHPLGLKLGCRVLVRVNLSSAIVNGSVGTVVGFRDCSVEHISRYLLHSGREACVSAYANFAKHELGYEHPQLPIVDFGNGLMETIPPCAFDVGGLADTHHYSASIIALPLTLAYAFTVHKVQGLTLVGRVHLELSKMWPCNHLLYVAFSRVRDPGQLTVSGFSDHLLQAASECLLFDDSLPGVDSTEIPSTSVPATWKQYPGKRKAATEQRRLRRVDKQQQRGNSPVVIPLTDLAQHVGAV